MTVLRNGLFQIDDGLSIDFCCDGRLASRFGCFLGGSEAFANQLQLPVQTKELGRCQLLRERK